MTDRDHTDSVASRPALDRFRDQYGDALIGAARARERERPRRRAPALVAVASVTVGVVLAASLLLDADRGAPLVGASPAEAAVRELRQSLRSGVLLREATMTDGPVKTTETDWTDLATRVRRTRARGGGSDVEFWNPSARERWTVDHALEAADGRAVAVHSVSGAGGAVNISSSASPIEEIEGLQALARSGELTLRRERTANGGAAIVLERQQRCFTAADSRASFVCPGTGAAAIEAAPAGLRPVTAYQTWWLADDETPRLLRLENGVIADGSTLREPQVRVQYSQWQVLPSTPEHLALVEPRLPAAKYLVLQGDDALAQALRGGTVRRR